MEAYERAVQETMEHGDVDALIAIFACVGDCDPNLVGRGIRRGVLRAERRTDGGVRIHSTVRSGEPVTAPIPPACLGCHASRTELHQWSSSAHGVHLVRCADCHRELAIVYERMGRYSVAITEWEEYMKQAPERASSEQIKGRIEALQQKSGAER